MRACVLSVIWLGRSNYSVEDKVRGERKSDIIEPRSRQVHVLVLTLQVTLMTKYVMFSISSGEETKVLSYTSFPIV